MLPSPVRLSWSSMTYENVYAQKLSAYWFADSSRAWPVSMPRAPLFFFCTVHYTLFKCSSVFLRHSLLQSSFQTVQTPDPLSRFSLSARGFWPLRDFTQCQRQSFGLPHQTLRRPQVFATSRRFIPTLCLQPYCMLLPRSGFCCSGISSFEAAVLSFERPCPLAVHFPNTNLLAQAMPKSLDSEALLHFQSPTSSLSG